MSLVRTGLMLLALLPAAPAAAAGDEADPVVRFWEARRVLLAGDAASAGELFRTVFNSAPKSTIADDCLYWYARCCLRQADREPEAVVALNRLLREYPDSRFVEEAAGDLAGLGDRTAVPLLLARLAEGGDAAEQAAWALVAFGEKKGAEWLAAQRVAVVDVAPVTPGGGLAAEVAALREQVKRLTADVAEALELLKKLLAERAGGKTEEKSR